MVMHDCTADKMNTMWKKQSWFIESRPKHGFAAIRTGSLWVAETARLVSNGLQLLQYFLMAFLGLRACRRGTGRGMFACDVVVYRESFGTAAIWRLQDPFCGVFHDPMIQFLRFDAKIQMFLVCHFVSVVLFAYIQIWWTSRYMSTIPLYTYIYIFVSQWSSMTVLA